MHQRQIESVRRDRRHAIVHRAGEHAVNNEVSGVDVFGLCRGDLIETRPVLDYVETLMILKRTHTSLLPPQTQSEAEQKLEFLLIL